MLLFGKLSGDLSMKIGDLKSLCSLWTNLATNHRYSPYVDKRDVVTFNERAACEGLPYLTVVLPSIGKALDRFHSTSEWNISTYGLKHCKRIEMSLKDGLGVEHLVTLTIPIFLGKAIEAAIKGDSLAVDCVRQLSYIFYKLETAYSDDLIEDFLASFRKVDAELFSSEDVETNSDVDLLLRNMKRLICEVLSNVDPLNIRPCHGSGATADRVKNWDKYHRFGYHAKLDALYPYSDYFFYNATHLVDELGRLEVAHDAIPRARIVLVPKDSRGPRVISCEPADMLYIQQGLMRLLYDTLESHPLTAGFVNFKDQTINKELARIGSITGEVATIDLSEASDRVSLSLIQRVFPANWVEALEACRSEETELPDGKIVKLNKFAPMGSSCCFPVEALVFWACAQASVRSMYPNSGSRRRENMPDIYVYGDDIAFGTQFFEPIAMGLESIGLKVNRDKSYVSGPFRESCGGDYHSGYDVTPIRVRKPFDISYSSSLSTAADLCNNFIAKFGLDESRSVVSSIETSAAYTFPRSDMPYPMCIKGPVCSSNDVFFSRRYNKYLQRYEHRILTSSNHIRQRRPSNWGELLRKELTREYRDNEPGAYTNPLQVVDSKLAPGQYADPHSARTKWVWVWLG